MPRKHTNYVLPPPSNWRPAEFELVPFTSGNLPVSPFIETKRKEKLSFTSAPVKNTPAETRAILFSKAIYECQTAEGWPLLKVQQP